MNIPSIETERILLRPASLDDVDWFFELRSDADFMRYMDRPLMTEREQAVAHIQNIIDRYESNTGVQWIMELRETGERIGYAGMWRYDAANNLAEVGYGMDPKFSGRGLMSEAIPTCLRFGFEEMKIHRMEAYVRPENTASVRVLESAGFTCEGRLRDTTLFEGTYRDLFVYSLLSTDSKQ